MDVLVESSTSIPDDIYVLENDTSYHEHVLVESSILIHVARYSLITPMIEDEIEYEIVITSIVTSNKPS